MDRNKLDRADATAPGAVDRLDEDAWDLQDQDDETVEGRRRYELAFRRARAAAAGTALTHAGTPLDEAVYEAIHALEPEVDVLDVLRT